AGSSSLKYQLININTEETLCKGGIERIGIKGTKLEHKIGDKKFVVEKDLNDHTEAFALVIETLTSKTMGVISSVKEIEAIGHRVLHSGEDFKCSVLINDDVVATLEKNIPLGPLHMPANIDCIKSCKKLLPDVPNVAVFDTAFHMTMPKVAYMYAIRYSDYEKFKVRKYGFHGTSHKFVTGECLKKLNTEHSKIVTCHLGNGSSITAEVDGKSVDTSMGLTPLEGLVMGTRCGDIDPAVVEYLMIKKKCSISEIMTYFNKECGYKGISELSSDSRDLVTASAEGNQKAELALAMSAYRIKKYIGAYAAVMNGLDAIVFTGGIGENSWTTRERICTGMEYLGLDFDFEKNAKTPRGAAADLHKEGSRVKVFVIPTNEELVIARETKDIVEKAKSAK
ncbi:MAG: acetate kinase, partial [Clostridia bacterium]